MRISDWSSDVCSSDLIGRHAAANTNFQAFEVFNFFNWFVGGKNDAGAMRIHAQELYAFVLIGGQQVFLVGIPGSDGAGFGGVARKRQYRELGQLESAGVVGMRNETDIDQPVAYRIKVTGRVGDGLG